MKQKTSIFMGAILTIVILVSGCSSAPSTQGLENTKPKAYECMASQRTALCD